MGRPFWFILQCMVILLFSQGAHACNDVMQPPAPHVQYFVHNNLHVPASFGLMYEAGKYPGRHRQFIHKKLVNPSSSAVQSEMWVMSTRVPDFTIYYFSSLYRSHISAILNSNDLLRGPPACLA